MVRISLLKWFNLYGQKPVVAESENFLSLKKDHSELAKDLAWSQVRRLLAPRQISRPAERRRVFGMT
jgi:hypothetical protein